MEYLQSIAVVEVELQSIASELTALRTGVDGEDDVINESLSKIDDFYGFLGRLEDLEEEFEDRKFKLRRLN